MKTKLLKRTLAAIAVLAFGLAFVFAALSGRTGGVTANAAEGGKPVSDNIFDIYASTVKWGYPPYANESFTYGITEDSEYGYIFDVNCDKTDADGNGLAQKRNNLIWYDTGNPKYWVAGWTYKISFDYKTVGSVSDKWSVSVVPYCNDAVTGSFSIKGTQEEWKNVNSAFTVPEDYVKNSTKNELRFIFSNFQFNDHVQIKNINISVTIPESYFDGKKDVAVGGIRAAKGGNSLLTKGTATDEVYGTVNQLTYKAAIPSTTNDIYWKDDMKWTVGATYTVYFMVRTSAGSTANAYVATQNNGSGYNTIVATANCINGTEILGWKPVACRFTLTEDMLGTGGRNAFCLVMAGGKEGDVVYYTDIKVFGNVSSVNLIADGKTVSSENVLIGSEYTLPDNTVSDTQTFVGWDYNGTIKSAGDKITVDSDVTLNRIAVDYTVEQGAYVRVAEDSGLRFVADISEEAIATLKKYGAVEFGMRFTSDSENLKGYFDVATNKWATEESEANKKFYTALTGFTADNNFYNVKFTARAYAKITDADGNVITVLTNADCTKSVAEIAKAALADTEADYTEDQLAIIRALTGEQGE